MYEGLINKVFYKVIEELDKKNSKLIPIEASARHVHLSKVDVEKLFGSGYMLIPRRELSQPGQFLCKERVNLIGPRGILKNVAILGPERKETQIEMSKSDAIAIGFDPPIRASGDILNTPSIFISTENKIIESEGGAIIPKRHIHMPSDIARAYGIEDKQIVKVKVHSDRPIIFEDVLVRVNDNYRLNMHIDFDEANSCNFVKGVKGEILMEDR